MIENVVRISRQLIKIRRDEWDPYTIQKYNIVPIGKYLNIKKGLFFFDFNQKTGVFVIRMRIV